MGLVEARSGIMEAGEPMTYNCRHCGKTLARMEEGYAVVAHARRIVLCRIYEITCDRCGTLTRYEDIPAAPTQAKGRRGKADG